MRDVQEQLRQAERNLREHEAATRHHTIAPDVMKDAADLIRTLAAERDRLAAENERLRRALGWYAELAAGCRKIGADGDDARNALHRDGGQRARALLNKEPTDDDA